MPESLTSAATNGAAPDYEALIRFLIQPFLESPDELKLDCEISPNRPRIWIRMAFEGGDKGRVFGRGGRNIQAIRTVLQAIAQLSGYSIHLDVYGGSPSGSGGEGGDDGEKSPPRRPPARRSSPRPSR